MRFSANSGRTVTLYMNSYSRILDPQLNNENEVQTYISTTLSLFLKQSSNSLEEKSHPVQDSAVWVPKA
jgi:hypothetical protein